MPSISLPKGGGAIRGMGEKFAANPVTGTGAITVPIPTSPGRSGFGPQLSLSYDSGSGNGPFGFGWTLSIPAIARKTDKGLPQYDDASELDVYVLSGSEDLVPVLEPDGRRHVDWASAPGFTIHRYRPRVEGLFARIERWTHQATREVHWRSISRENVTTLYGRDRDARIFDPSDPTRIFSWLACASHDDKGNAIVYEYAAEDGAGVDRAQANERNRTRTANRYLKRIKYGNRVSRLVQPDLTTASWLFEVVFDYDEGHYAELPLDPSRSAAEQPQLVRAASSADGRWTVRPDPVSAYRAGFEVRTYRRCRRVLMFHRFAELNERRFAELGDAPYLVRSIDLDYADLDYTHAVTAEDELAHQGSTRFASFIRSITHSGFVRDDSHAAIMRNGIKYITYLKKSLPPLEFEYSKAKIQDEIRELDTGSVENLPVGLDGTTYRWVDLDGEGVSGILTEQAGGWFYKPSLGEGRFGAVRVLPTQPSLLAMGSGGTQLLDLSGNGQLDIVSFAGPTPGFYARTQDEDWEPFRMFGKLPNLRWDDPNLRFVDLDGAGQADILITENDVFTWYSSLAEDGFGPARQVRPPTDEERGPRLVLADGTQSIYLADLCGDGLADLVRIRNGEVCYWPNLGYGRFGAKVTMDNAPWFDNPDQFDQRRIRLADIDGSGTIDIIYLGHDGVWLYFNQSGNRWSDARRLPHFPRVDNLSSVTTADLLGNGTACLVWSSPLPADARRPVRYIDLMGGQKPHLLVRSVNNLGAETRIDYAPSTKFYLADKRAGTPWITRLPFPVHVVERVRTHDHISGNRFASGYTYHHGYFDGVEREFRGFGMVEQQDTEELATFAADSTLPAATNADAASHLPPVLTRTWFHTGVYLDRDHVSDFFAGLLEDSNPGEYYREPGLTDAQQRARLLPDTVVPPGLTLEDEREACRALKGMMLRQEVYALDGTDKAGTPYSVVEQNFTIERLQPRAGNRHAAFFTHARETLSYHYERDPVDPRISHTLTLEVDAFGNVLRSLAVAYGRRIPSSDPALTAEDRAKQAGLLVTYSESSYTENDVTAAVRAAGHHRAPLPAEARTYELTGFTPEGGAARFSFDEWWRDGFALLSSATDLAYEVTADATTRQKRLIEHVRTLYRRDDLTGLSPPGRVEAQALVGETYKLALTPGLIARVFTRRQPGQPDEHLVLEPTALLEGQGADQGGYVAWDGNWWIPSGRVFFDPGASLATPALTAALELRTAREHFYVPRKLADAFGQSTVVDYDASDLLVVRVSDALGNMTAAIHDLRVLQPALVIDANRNRTAAAFDALGMVVATAVMGKEGEHVGDLLEDFTPDPSLAELQRFVADPGARAPSLLGKATSRFVYDLGRYVRAGQPPFVASLARETHFHDVSGDRTRIQIGFSYSDGFGREIQKKLQAEAGDAPERRAPVRLPSGDIGPGDLVRDAGGELVEARTPRRWVGSGRTVFNNKGKPVRQYEPFFSATHLYEPEREMTDAGVSPVLFYDPAGRIVATLHPNRTYEKVVFDPWRQAAYDVNDTVAASGTQTGDPRTDEDIRGYVAEYFRSQPASWQTWHAQRIGNALGAAERDAARKAAAHADTPTVTLLDALGRSFLTIAHNKVVCPGHALDGTEDRFATRIKLDIEGNQRAVRDAKDRVVMRYDHDLLGNRLHQASMEAGERWMLSDAAGKPIRAWDSRGHAFRTEYDGLRRPVQVFVRGADLAAPDREILCERTEYGEGQIDDLALNLRTRVFRQYDGAGTVTQTGYDFKGNLLGSTRQLAADYKNILDWSMDPDREGPAYTSRTTYDALDRPVEITSPDGSHVRPVFNEANLLERIEVNLQGAAEMTAFVRNIDYDAKGQRVLVEYGNGASTTYTYDRLTFRVTQLSTDRGSETGSLQDLYYTYDAAGNITYLRDGAQQTIYFNNHVTEPIADYTYDATYQLIAATGREHLGQIGGLGRPLPMSDTDAPRVGLAHPNDGRAMGRYLQQYVYDEVGNFLGMAHQGDPGQPGWTRDYAYSEPSQLEPEKSSNRLSSTSIGVGTERYTYDAHGNMTSMPHLPLMWWDHRDRLQATSRQVVSNGATPEITYYVYDAAGQRVRKVTEGQAAARQRPRRKAERIYLAGFEIYREYGDDDEIEATLERETLHVMDGARRGALVETRTRGNDGSPAQLVRYQLDNQLGSACLELDGGADVISYEEYYPYGSTSYQAVRSTTEAPKRYRYTGLERDEESGLGYHGARYYAPWLGRWTAADPDGLKDGSNVYGYVRNTPVGLVDDSGTQGHPPRLFPDPGSHWSGLVVHGQEWEYQLDAPLVAPAVDLELSINIDIESDAERMLAPTALYQEPPRVAGISDIARTAIWLFLTQPFQSFEPRAPEASEMTPETLALQYAEYILGETVGRVDLGRFMARELGWGLTIATLYLGIEVLTSIRIENDMLTNLEIKIPSIPFDLSELLYCHSLPESSEVAESDTSSEPAEPVEPAEPDAPSETAEPEESDASAEHSDRVGVEVVDPFGRYWLLPQ